jgi:hypothetical protein
MAEAIMWALLIALCPVAFAQGSVEKGETSRQDTRVPLRRQCAKV